MQESTGIRADQVLQSIVRQVVRVDLDAMTEDKREGFEKGFAAACMVNRGGREKYLEALGRGVQRG